VNYSHKIVAAFVLAAVCAFAQTSKSALASDPAGWEDILPPTDFHGWTRLPIAPDALSPVTQWKRQGDLLICEGNRGHAWLRQDRETSDFILHAEFRFKPIEGRKGYNSGIFVRNDADYTNNKSTWIQMQVGSPMGAYLFGVMPINGKLQSFNLVSRMKAPPLTGPGEWNIVEITAQGPLMRVWANGSVVCEYPYVGVASGHIGLEAEGYEIEFRNLKLKPLTRASVQ
jgi:hypothetical protein